MQYKCDVIVSYCSSVGNMALFYIFHIFIAAITLLVWERMLVVVVGCCRWLSIINIALADE